MSKAPSSTTQLSLFLSIFLGSTALLFAGSNPPHPEGLLLRGFESEAAYNRRGDQAVLNGVSTTVRIDAAGEVASGISAADIAPLVGWYRDRDQYYSAYADFAPGIGSAPGFTDDISSAGKTLDLDGTEAGPSIFLDETYQTILTVAKAYVDAGVDAIHYDTAWVTLDAGPFDSAAMSDFRTWLNAQYTEPTLQSYIDATYDDATFDYGAFLRSKNITASNYSTASISSVKLGATKHWRLWQAFQRSKEREVIATLVDAVNTYAQAELGREIGFYFNRYGFINRPADRWFLAEYASGDLGETHFAGQSWEYADGHNLEPVFRANLKTNDNRFEPWNAPPAVNTAVQSLFLAETIANNGVATWEDDYPATAPIARLARQYESQLDHDTISEAAIFYPLATSLHTEPLQVGPDAGLIGGDHYWYLGLGYILQELDINYDVAFGGDGLGMPDAFSTSDISGYPVVFASEAIQVTDNQFTALMDYVNGGGTLIVTGTNCLRYDALGNDMSGSRTYDSKTWSQLLGSVANTTIGSGTLKVVSLDPWGTTGYTDQPSSAALTTTVSGLESALPSSLKRTTSDASGEVRILSYKDSSDNSNIYQLLNYSFNGAGTAITTQSSFTVTLNRPVDYVGTYVASYVSSADSSPTTLTITHSDNGTSQVTIPSLSYWGIIRIGSAIPDTAHPDIDPIAYFNSLFSYEVFDSTATRTLTYDAFDDDEIDQLQIYYSKKDGDTGIFGAWTPSQIIAGTGIKEYGNASVDFTLPSEGHFRLQMIATDSDSATNALLGDDAYDTEVGYDTTVVDRSALVVTPLHGTTSGSIITAPLTPSFSFTGQNDSISGFGQYNWSWNNGGNTITGGGNPLTETITIDSIPEIVEGEYGEYVFSLRFQNGANIWDDSENEYTLIYTLPPTYNGSETTETTTDNSNVDFTLDYTSVFGDTSILWYKDDVLVEGQTEGTLSLFNANDDNNGTYHATITNPAGQVTSTDFILTVTTPLEVTQQPAGDILNEGEPFSVTVEARGTGTLLYQWMLEGVDITGATNQTYSIESAVKATHNGHYRVTITDDLTSIESNGAFVQISDQPGGGGDGAPTSPNNISANDNGSDSVTITWQDNSNNETGFALERRQQGTDNWISVSGAIPANDTQFIDATNIGTDTYEYRLKATGSSGDSNYSGVATVSRSSGPGPLSAPTSLSASDNTASVFLTWSDNATSETGYTIERKLQSAGSWSVVANIGPNAQGFTHPVNIGTNSYEYRVKATDGSNSSDYSNIAAVSRQGGGGGGGGGTLPAPTNLALLDEDTRVKITWTDNSQDETGFLIEYKEQNTTNWQTAVTAAPNAESFNHSLDIGTTIYEYRIKALRSEENSEYTAVVSIEREKISILIPEPTDLALIDENTQVKITWTDNSGDETGFLIEYKQQENTNWLTATTTAANTESFNHSLDIGTKTYEYRLKAIMGEESSEHTSVVTIKREIVVSPTATLTTSISPTNSGTVTGGGTYDEGENVLIEAIPAEGYVFVRWTDGLTGSTNPATIKLNSNTTVTAHFEEEVVELPVPTKPTLVSTDAGSITFEWTIGEGDISGFSVESQLDGITWTELSETASGVTVYTHSDLAPGQEYIYRVIAKNNSEASNSSPSETFSTLIYGGYFIGELDNNAGSFAAVVTSDGLATFLIHLITSNTIIEEYDIQLDPDGSYAFESDGNSVTGVAPLFSVTSVASETEGDALSIAINGASGSATKEPGSNDHSDSAGYYQGLVGSGHSLGMTHIVKAPSGKVLAINEYSDGSTGSGIGQSDAEGDFSITTNDGTELTATLNPETQVLAGSLVSSEGEVLGFSAVGESSVIEQDRLINISTRGPISNGDDVMIGGFVISGDGPKLILLTAKGPSLADAGVANVLPDPRLTLYQLIDDKFELVTVVSSWSAEDNSSEISATGYGPVDEREPAMLAMLDPGIYTAIVDSDNPESGTGVALVEVYEIPTEGIDQPARMVNISTRGLVGAGDDSMIAGFVIQGTLPKTVLINAKGPSLAAAGITNPLEDPNIVLYKLGDTFELIDSNNNWQDADNSAEIANSGFGPEVDSEAAMLRTLEPGVYTAIVTSQTPLAEGEKRVGLVEVYEISD